MYKFSYDGPVYYFGREVCASYKAVTVAPTESKAVSNISYRYKKQIGSTARAQFGIDRSRVKLVSEV